MPIDPTGKTQRDKRPRNRLGKGAVIGLSQATVTITEDDEAYIDFEESGTLNVEGAAVAPRGVEGHPGVQQTGDGKREPPPGGPIVERYRGAHLLNDAVIENRDSIRNGIGLLLIVGHEDGG